MATYVHSIFCEDIRPEIGGKFSLMGILGNEIIVPQAPIAVPKICVSIWVVTSADKIFRKVKIRALFEKEVLIEAEPLIEFPPEPENISEKKRKSFVLRSQFQIAISPFIIPKAGYLRIRVHLDDGPEIKGGALQVLVSPERFQEMFQQLNGSLPQP